jgi:hypothetical protein
VILVLLAEEVAGERTLQIEGGKSDGARAPDLSRLAALLEERHETREQVAAHYQVENQGERTLYERDLVTVVASNEICCS